MKAIVQNAYGSPDVLQLKEVADPVIKENEVLVRVTPLPSTPAMSFRCAAAHGWRGSASGFPSRRITSSVGTWPGAWRRSASR
jgi:hypothetical protein